MRAIPTVKIPHATPAAPMLYALGFIGLFTIGWLTGLFLAALAVDVHVHDTYFVIAHFHYIMVGGMVMAYLGALHFWWPKISGRFDSRGRLLPSARLPSLVVEVWQSGGPESVARHRPGMDHVVSSAEG